VSEKILILDFGSQYTQLIARKVREHNVYCEIHPFSNFPDPDGSVKGIILSGSPFSVRDKHAPIPNLDGIKGKYPLLGICYGAQFLSHHYGGEVLQSDSREYGRARLNYINTEHPLLKNMKPNSQVWMSHADTINSLPSDCDIIASTEDVKVGAYASSSEPSFGLQFHPEVYHTTEGLTILHNFLDEICGCAMDWTPETFVESTVNELKAKLGTDHVVLGLSGGVDSTVASILLHRAIGPKLTCIFVDNGLLRKDEFHTVLDSYKELGLNVIGVDASDRFIDDLEGVTDPEAKRKSIGKNFIRVFEEEAEKLEDVKWLGQGTIYPDVIESVSVNGPSVTIKSHHNVGGLPDIMHLKVVEPLRLLFKD
jgi:GMP synthase (glutamine-hydrolysing)